MTEHDIDLLLQRQRQFFHTGTTLPVPYRIAALKKLYTAIQHRQKDIASALHQDLGKSEFEGHMCEIGLSLTEISYMLRHVRRLAGKRRAPTPLAQFPSRSYQLATPYGNTLIMSPWNYPFLLTIEPLTDAIAAGNTAIIKPSAYSPATSALLEEMIRDIFPPEYVAVVTGGRKENACLLEKKFDFVFFTGSTNVGKEVLRHAAEHLTPVVLELGGKSPCIVDATADLSLAARRIVFGKYLNCGQTCVAPDYILAEESIKDALVREIRRQIVLQFGEHPLQNPAYGRIVTEKHFDRLLGLMQMDKVIHGGQHDRSSLRIAPTVMDCVSWDDPVMQEEIFGPIMPVLTFRSLEDVIGRMHTMPTPLALYFFSGSKENIHSVTTRCQFGGGCINDVIIHLATSDMPFGGVGESGMGSYHGKTGFDTFSHIKSIVDKKTWLDLPMRYQPYKPLYRKLLDLFLR